MLLGATAARDLFGELDPTGSRITINRVPFIVEGVLAERGQGLDSSNEDDEVYVPLDTAMHRLLNIDYFSSILFNIETGRGWTARRDRFINWWKSGIDTEHHALMIFLCRIEEPD